MMFESVYQIIAIIFGSSAITAIITRLINAKKNKQEVESLIVENYKKLVSDLRIQVEILQKRMDNYTYAEKKMQDQIKELREENDELRIKIEKCLKNKKNV